jgi:hypothetical protein
VREAAAAYAEKKKYSSNTILNGIKTA